MQVNNGFGSALGAAQLILYAIYRGKQGEKVPIAENGDLEMEANESSKKKQTHAV